MKKFIDVLNQFILLYSTDKRDNLFALLPNKIAEGKTFFYKEMFINPERHFFYIFTSLLIDWIFELEEQYPEKSKFLSEIHELLEYIDDDISAEEQKEMVETLNKLVRMVEI